MQSNKLDDVCKVCITTIQRLYSMLKGEPEFDPGNEERSMFSAGAVFKEPVPVSYNPALPIETFDFIVTDECHRSIYNLWRQVLEDFDAFFIGLTATPSKQTFGFFNQNLVTAYGHEQAVADGVNVDFMFTASGPKSPSAAPTWMPVFMSISATGRRAECAGSSLMRTLATARSSSTATW
jgi:type I restriction enzyme R subunit